MTLYLELEQALAVVAEEGIGPVLDAGMLDSALARPQASAFGEDAYPTLDLKAAALLHSLAKNHPLVDGNKRLAWLLTETFVMINGFVVDLTNDEVYDLVMDVATSRVTDLKVIAERMAIKRRV